MKGGFRFPRLEELMLRRKRIALAAFSYALIFIIFLNLTYVHSVLVGTVAFVPYFVINGIFWGFAIFEEENLFLRLTLGFLLLIVFIGLVGWFVLIAYNLDVPRTILTLSIVAALPLLFKMKLAYTRGDSAPSSKNEWGASSRFYMVRFLYLFMVFLSFYLLYTSRAGEVRAVWQFMNPLFVPILFATTVMLLLVIFSSDKLGHKLLFIVLHSILIHTFFVIVFPVGDVGYQARILADTRSIFDNAMLNGWPPQPAGNILSQIWYWFRGVNLQSALSVVFARSFSVDVLWSHLLLVPVLWGVFVPVAAFMVTQTLYKSERTALLASLVISSFPLSVYFGALSLPISLGYLFFFFAVLFTLRYLSSNEFKNSLFAVMFTVVSFLSHFLTGIMSFSLILLVMALKRYKAKRNNLPIPEKFLLLIAFLLCTSLIPLALVYQRLFHPYGTAFSLYRFYKWPLEDIVTLFVFEEYVNFWVYAAIVHVIGPIAGFLGMLYCLISRDKQRFGENRCLCWFFVLGVLIVLIDYRILKLFMVRVPFNEERLWVFRDFLAVPFVAILADLVLTRLKSMASSHLSMMHLRSSPLSININVKSLVVSAIVVISIISYVLGLLALPASTTASVYYAYPHYGPLQISTYELEAARFIDESTVGSYVVISDQWMIFAGQIIVGSYNPRAHYFNPSNPKGVALFLEMKKNPRPEPMIEAMRIANATVAYFIIEKPRLGAELYSRIIDQAQENNLQTFQTFDYNGEEKLRVFWYSV